jgi:hypothetical protein
MLTVDSSILLNSSINLVKHIIYLKFKFQFFFSPSFLKKKKKKNCFSQLKFSLETNRASETILKKRTYQSWFLCAIHQ